MDKSQIESGVLDYLASIEDIRISDDFAGMAEQRRAYLEQVAKKATPRNWTDLHVDDYFIAMAGREIPLRIYRPASAGLKPLILFFHGGGWLMGSINTHDYLAAALARSVDSVVVSVHYRRTPENQYPAQIDDCFEALLWAEQKSDFLGIDPERIAVAGDSAGAYLSICCALRARDKQGPKIAYQLLIYPMIEPNFETASYQEFADAPGLTRQDCILFWQGLFGKDMTDPPIDALPARNDLRNLPPAAVITAAFDPLRDEGETFAAKLAEAGVHVDLHRAEKMIHGFLRSLAYSSAVKEELDLMGQKLRQALW